jgi:hypothetical protein
MSASHLGFAILAQEEWKGLYMDKFTKLVSESQIAVVVAGLPAFNRFELLSLDAPGDDAAAVAARQGLQFLGVISLDRHFKPRTEFAVELSSDQLKFIADQFVLLIERAVCRVENMGWTPDPRAN